MKVPSVSELNYCCKHLYTAPIICKMEVLLLNILNWELMLLTPRHFLQMLFARGASCIYPDDLIGNDQVSFDRHLLVQRYLRKYAEFFTDLCLHGTLPFSLFSFRDNATMLMPPAISQTIDSLLIFRLSWPLLRSLRQEGSSS